MHWFLDPIKHHYADFAGRASRQTFWMYVLLYVLVYIVVSVVATALDLFALTILFSLALLVPSVAIGTRRLHDTGLSGWWQLLGLIPFVGWIIVVILMVRPSDPGTNQYDVSNDVQTAAATDTTAAPANNPAPEAEPAPQENTQQGYNQQ